MRDRSDSPVTSPAQPPTRRTFLVSEPQLPWASALRHLTFLFLLTGCSSLLGQIPQTLFWGSPGATKLVIGKPVPIEVFASSGLPVTFVVDHGPAVIADGTLTPTGFGTIRVTARQAGNAEFLPESATRVYNPTELQSSVVGTLDIAGKVRVQDNLLFVAGPALEIFDITDPAHPAFRGRLEVADTILDAAPAGRYVLVTTGNFLKIADVSQPDHPTWVGNLDLGSPPEAVAVDGTFAGITRHPHGVDLIDWADPQNPKRLGNVTPPLPVTVNAIAMRNGWVYVSGSDLPVTGLATPFTDPGTWDNRVSLWGPNSQLDTDARSLVMVQNVSVGILDLAQPESAPTRSDIPSGLFVASVRLLGDWLYVAGWGNGLWAMEVADRGLTLPLTQLVHHSPAQSIDGRAGYVFVGTDSGPTTILKLRVGLTQEFLWTTPSEIWVTNGPVTLELVVSGSSGSPATFQLLDGPGVLSGNQLTLTNAGYPYGEWVIPGNDQFFEARGGWTVVARKLTQSISFRPPPILGLSQGPISLQASASSGLPVTFEVVSGPATLEGQRLTPNAVGTVVVRAIQEGNLAYLPAEPFDATIQIFQIPEIVRQPNPTNVPSGSPVTLEVIATASTSLSFQWYKDGLALPNETQAVLHREAASLADMGLYSVSVGQEFGGTIKSSVVSLTVDLPGSEVRLRPRGNLPHRNAPTSSNPGRIEVQGDYAYVVNQALRDLQVFNIRDPDAPYRVATIPLLSSLHQDLAYKDGHLLLAEREQGIGIIDVSNPEKPVRLPTYRFPGNRADVVTVQVIGNQAFVGNGSYGFALLDVTNPREPNLISSLDTRGLVAGLWIEGDQAYVADWASGFKVLDLANPTAPRLIGRYPENDAPLNYYDLVSRKGWVYLVHQDLGLVTFDLSHPTTPMVTQTNRGSIIGLDLAGRTLFAADNASQPSATGTPGVRLFDLNRPESPANLGRFSDWGRMDGVRIEGSRLYVTGDRFGIIDIEFPQRPPGFFVEPRPQILQPGESGQLNCVAEGSDPLSYQWWFRGAPLLNATNRSLSLGPITEENAGLYTVEVRNPWGTIRSSPARVGFGQQIHWDALPTNAVLRVQQPHNLPASSDLGLPLSHRIVSGPAMITQGKLWITNTGTVRLIAEHPGSDAVFPITREWELNVGAVHFVERGHWPGFHSGTVAALDVEGSLAIVAIRNGGLLALDVSDPTRPRLLGELWSGTSWTDVRVSQGLAYALNNDSGLMIVDFRDPAHPVVKSTSGHLTLDGGIQMVNQLVYVYGPGSPLRVFDVSDPTAPILLPTSEGFQDYSNLVVRGDRAFATRWTLGVEVIDVRDPQRLELLFVMNPLGRPKALDVQGDRVALLPAEGGLELFDITANGALEPSSRLELPGSASDIVWSGQHLWVTLDDSGLVQVDATAPHQPSILTTVPSPVPSQGMSVRLIGDYAYLTDPVRGIAIYHLRSQNEPTLVGWFPTSCGAGVVRVDGTRAYVLCEEGGLSILDIADPDHPTRLGGMPPQGFAQSLNSGSMAVSGHRVFYPAGGGGVQIVDVQDPTAPARIGSIPIWGIQQIQAPVESELHLTSPDVRRTHVYDVRDASDPVLISSLLNGMNPMQVSDHLRFGAATGKLLVEDVTSPETPTTLANVGLGLGNVRSMTLEGDRLFFGSFAPSALSVIDFSDPRRPFLQQQLPGSGSYHAMDVEGDYLVVANDAGGLAAFHAFLRDGLKPAGSISGGMFARDLQMVGNLAYVADGLYGFKIFELRSGIEQAFPDLPPGPVTQVGGVFDLPAKSEAGFPIRYTVVDGSAVIENGRLRFPSEGPVTLRAELEGDLQFFPRTVERTYQVFSPPAITLEPADAGLRIRWKVGVGADRLVISESASGPWQLADILSAEYLEAEATQVLLVPTPSATRFYRVLRD